MKVNNKFRIWITYRIAGRQYETPPVHITVQEPPQWIVTTDKLGYAPGATVTARREIVGGDTKWEARSRANGFYLWEPSRTSARARLLYSKMGDHKDWTYVAQSEVGKPHTVGTDGVTQDRVREAWARVRVIDCPVEDSALNEQALRDSIAATISRQFGKKETLAWLLRNPQTGEITYVNVPTPSDNCSAESIPRWNELPDSIKSRVVGVFHPHNRKPGDELPAGCVEDPGKSHYGAGEAGGFSDGDIISWYFMKDSTAGSVRKPDAYTGDVQAMRRLAPPPGIGLGESKDFAPFARKWQRGPNCPQGSSNAIKM
jgi:hypothetical protein